MHVYSLKQAITVVLKLYTRDGTGQDVTAKCFAMTSATDHAAGDSHVTILESVFHARYVYLFFFF